MSPFFDSLRRWRIASRETHVLLNRNAELLARRVQLLDAANREFRDLVRLARDFTDEAAGRQEPAARSVSPRRR